MIRRESPTLLCGCWRDPAQAVYPALLSITEKVLVLWERGDPPCHGAGGWPGVPCSVAFGCEATAFLQGWKLRFTSQISVNIRTEGVSSVLGRRLEPRKETLCLLPSWRDGSEKHRSSRGLGISPWRYVRYSRQE